MPHDAAVQGSGHLSSHKRFITLPKIICMYMYIYCVYDWILNYIYAWLLLAKSCQLFLRLSFWWCQNIDCCKLDLPFPSVRFFRQAALRWQMSKIFLHLPPCHGWSGPRDFTVDLNWAAVYCRNGISQPRRPNLDYVHVLPFWSLIILDLLYRMKIIQKFQNPTRCQVYAKSHSV